MNNIIEPNETFDFTKLSLAHPSGVQGGAYFTKIEYNNKPLYIQTIKSLTRQGFVKTGKKYYCDLMFDKNAESLIHWFENLEETCKKLIYEKRESWFQNTLEESDIETAFNSLIRIYKSGKYYLVRTNIRNTRTDEPAINIYNENEITMTMEDVTTDTNIISILEIQGIKFTSRNFQIEIELKQVMVLDNEPIFNSCLIKSSKNGPIHTKSEVGENKPKIEDFIIDSNIPIINTNVDEKIDDTPIHNKIDGIDENISLNVDEESKALEPIDINLLANELDIELEEIVDDELKEVDIHLPLENDVDSFKLKKPNQVYFELYTEARKKAKDAKKNAILAYLEAKNIKKTYMIENINESDSDFDAEIDDASESELEGL